MKDRHIAIGALMACCFFYPVTKAQITGEAEQSLSSADAARPNREQKRDVIRRSKRITDDDLKVQFGSGEEGGVRLGGVANAGGTPASVGELPIAQAIRGQASPDIGDTVAISGG